MIGTQKGRKEPGTEETRAAGDEEALIAHLVPQWFGVVKDEIEIRRRNGVLLHYGLRFLSS